MMKIRTITALVALMLSGSALAATSEGDAFLARHGLEGKNVEQLVEAIDGSTQARPLAYSAGITSGALVLSDEKQRVSYPLGINSIFRLRLTFSKPIPALTTAFPAARGSLPTRRLR